MKKILIIIFSLIVSCFALTGCEIDFENKIENSLSSYQVYSLMMCCVTEYFNSPPTSSNKEDLLALYTSYFKVFLNADEISYILTTDETFSNKLIVSSGDYVCAMLFNEQINGKEVSHNENQILSTCYLDGIIYDNYNNEFNIHAIHNINSTAHLFNYRITRKISAIISKDPSISFDNYTPNENSIKIEENINELYFDTLNLTLSATQPPLTLKLNFGEDDYNISKISTNNYKISSTNELFLSKKLSFLGKTYSFSNYQDI